MPIRYRIKLICPNCSARSEIYEWDFNITPEYYRPTCFMCKQAVLKAVEIKEDHNVEWGEIS